MRVVGLLMLLGALQVMASTKSEPITLNGHWLTDKDQQVMFDPQTSGLIHWQGNLLTVSDASAHESQRLRLTAIDQERARVLPGAFKMAMSEQVKNTCFAEYLAVRPDLEALVVDPDNDKVFVVVTEDASQIKLSESCQKQFKDSGSADYPMLLLRLEMQSDNSLRMTHVRPIQYLPEHNIDPELPNDGIEGMAFGKDRTLYLALEKDAKGQPRVFTLQIDEQFWQQTGFAQVSDPALLTPTFEKGSHPINGMDYHPGYTKGSGFLLAAARNDDQVWIIDIDKKLPTRIIDLKFLAEIPGSHESCGQWEEMDNASIEGLAVTADDIWLINDPWKVNYHKNIRCEANRDHYTKMAPLLFRLPIQKQWFKP